MTKRQILAEKLPVSLPTLRKLIREGKLPKPVILGKGPQGDMFNEAEVDRAIEKLVAESSAQQRNPAELERLRANSAKANAIRAEKRGQAAA